MKRRTHELGALRRVYENPATIFFNKRMPRYDDGLVSALARSATMLHRTTPEEGCRELKERAARRPRARRTMSPHCADETKYEHRRSGGEAFQCGAGQG